MSALKAWLDGWVFQAQYLPGWLSAFAALVALFISVWASLRVGKAERRKDWLQSRVIAVAIYPEVAKLETTINDVHQGLALVKTRAGALAGQSVVAEVQRVALIPVPAMLDRNVDKLFMLGGVVGPTCLQIVTVLLQYNEAVEVVTSRMFEMGPEKWLEGVDHIEAHLGLLAQVATKATGQLRKINETIKA
jgi:hypothetical protein